MKRSFKVANYLVASLILLSLMPVFLQAQTINLPAGYKDVTEDDGFGGTQHVYITTIAESSTTYTVDFNHTGGTGSPTWSASSISCSPGACPAGIAIDATTGILSFVPNTSTAITMNVTVVAGGTPVTQLVRITIRKPIDLVLVLDKSGSMDATTIGSTTRWQALVKAVQAFVDKFEEFRIDGDRIGISYFHTVVQNGLGTGAEPFISIRPTAPSSRLQVDSSLGKHGPDGATAMGEGVIDAKAKLTVTTKTRIELLFTDGEQNYPYGTARLVAATGDKLGDGTAINTGPGSSAGSIKIYTIGIGAEGSLPLVLSAIASANRGRFWTTQTGADGAFVTDFTSAFASILSQFSPQILGTYNGQLTGTQLSDSVIFNCNSSTDKLLFEVYGSGRLQVSIEKNNKVVLPSLVRTGSDYRIYVYNFPHSDTTLKPGGKWKVKVRTAINLSSVNVAGTGNALGAFEVVAITDDHWFDYTCSTGATNFKTGDELKPVVKLSHGTTAITKAHVHAILLKPGQTLGNLLATTNIAIPPVSGLDTSSAGVRKYEQLLNDPAFLAKMLPKEQSFDLAHTSDGSYTASGGKLDTSGVYRLIIFISDTLSNGDIVQRRDEQALYVLFSDIDLSASNAVLTGSGNNWVLQITPMTNQHLLVGPAFHQVFSVTGTDVVLQDVIDMGDGSYQLKIVGSSGKNVNISILDVPIYKGELGNISCYGPNASLWQKIKCWLIRMGLPAWSIWIIMLLLLLLLIWILRKLLKK
ncbi:MAG: VWA domain-containing protein [Bacteroidetes bacterium]|nr:MAG: VWA domain-containing protein [Bacteroidota bacterium]